MRRQSIAVIGAGHNALVCACYLAKAGHDVTVFESRLAGGRGRQHGGVVARVPGRYLLGDAHPDPQDARRSGSWSCASSGWTTCRWTRGASRPSPTGRALIFYRDLDRTCQSIARISERDAEAYRAFVLKWHDFNQPVFELFSEAPAPGAASAEIARRTAIGQIKSRGQADPAMSGLPLLSRVLGNYGKMLDETFGRPR